MGQRVDISGGIVAGLGGRYATALFELAKDGKAIDAVSASLAKLRQALAESSDFAELTRSPVIGRDAGTRAALATADSLKVDTLTRNFLGLLGKNRRLAALPAIISGFMQLAAHHRGETTAEVTAAHHLSDDQTAALKAKLKAMVGSDVAVDIKVDPEILGGLVVRVGSRMIDSSIRTKLDTLAQAMKG